MIIDATRKLIENPSDAVVFAPNVTITHDGLRPPLVLPAGKKLAVSLLLHAPQYQDTIEAGDFGPGYIAGGVGREANPPKGQVARLSQWDFGLTVGIFRLLSIAEKHGVPAAVALDEYGVTRKPGLARAVAPRAAEIVCRGRAATLVVSPQMSEEQERSYIRESKASVETATGSTVAGWFSPERCQSQRTPRLLAEEGFAWFGDWPADERPVPLDGAANGLTAVPFGLETEDMFAMYTRNLPYLSYEDLVDETVDQLVADADIVGGRFLGLNWFGWVLGQACYADVADRLLGRLASRDDVLFVTPAQAAEL
ncbi:hypothetical protein [Rhodococcus sp. NPDC047139]|uniref:hypothetical protein n=1 Tax=Rhodococcus sp. NPDC047139 TaxID=3155141 RepID=UPI003405C5D6